MATRVSNPFDLFTDTDGSPLESGYIYIGVANLNPIIDPQVVFWDAGLTIPAVQPVRTIGGFPAYNGAPSRLYVPSAYSIIVQNKQQSLVFSDLNVVNSALADLLDSLKTVDGAGSGLVAEGIQSLQITDLNFDPALLALAVREVRVYNTASGPLNQPGGVPTSTYYTLMLSQPNAGEYRVVLVPGGTVGEIYTRTYSGAAWGAWSSTGGGAPLALAAVASPYTQIAGAAPLTYYVTTGASAFTFNLATAASQVGRRITIAKADSGAGALNVVPNGADVIGAAGNTTVPISLQGQSITLLAAISGRWEVVAPIVDTDGLLTANSDVRVVSQKAAKPLSPAFTSVTSAVAFALPATVAGVWSVYFVRNTSGGSISATAPAGGTWDIIDISDSATTLIYSQLAGGSAIRGVSSAKGGAWIYKRNT